MISLINCGNNYLSIEKLFDWAIIVISFQLHLKS